MRLVVKMAAGLVLAAGSTAVTQQAAPAAPAAAYHSAVSSRPKTVALTFDDGPSPYTPQILKILRRHQVKATFCMLGSQTARYRTIARRVVADGHRLCNHSRNHPDFTTLSNSAARTQIRQTQRTIRNVTGRSPKTFRFPYGASNSRTRAIVRDEGLRILGWTVDTRDWERPGAAKITNRAVRNAHPGAVILMHDGGGDRRQTVASLDDTIRRLKAKGYTFVRA